MSIDAINCERSRRFPRLERGADPTKGDLSAPNVNNSEQKRRQHECDTKRTPHTADCPDPQELIEDVTQRYGGDDNPWSRADDVRTIGPISLQPISQ
jgi:hypothetical protein